jgi:hypothetical protein
LVNVRAARFPVAMSRFKLPVTFPAAVVSPGSIEKLLKFPELVNSVPTSLLKIGLEVDAESTLASPVR